MSFRITWAARCAEAQRLKGNSFNVLAGQPNDPEPEPEPTSSSSAHSNSKGTTTQANTKTSLKAKAAQAKSETRAQLLKRSAGRLAEQNGELKDPLVWIDLEMTGLQPEKDTILEIAVILTDGELSIMLEGPAMAIHQSDEVLRDMNDWCKLHHKKSGLTQRVKDSTSSMEQAQAEVLAFVTKYVKPNTGILAGNSIHTDRSFLVKYMPELVEHLHYRVVDVSSVTELARRWYPAVYKTAPRKVMAHTALSDIWESIEELQFYRKAVFVPQNKSDA